ncbi:MAG: outer membrane protein OmpA-like peptidoglycan-associated protein [Desulforhopalus sp.]|jgi:outer membrane protein OmpA-like peptidoglycan-associated protein
MNLKVIWLLSGFLFLGACANDTAQDRKNLNTFEKLEYQVKKTHRGVEIIFPEVLLFDFDSDRLKSAAKEKMYQIAEIVNEPKVESRMIAVEGHADSIGSDAYNMDLSKRRSESVSRALVFSGVRKGRLATRGFGDRNPIAPNKKPEGSDNPEGRTLNRRVELIIEYSRIEK